MLQTLNELNSLAGGADQLLLLVGVFGAVLLLAGGAVVMLAPRDAVERRLDVGAAAKGGAPLALRRSDEDEGRARLTSILAPGDDEERSKIRKKLTQAGIRGSRAVIHYYTIRTVLGLLLPLPILLITALYAVSVGGIGVQIPLIGVSASSTLVNAVVLMLIGFYGPPIWLRLRVAKRQQAISEAFPYALDMMRVAIEAGLGFDAALARVAEELAVAHPALAEEFAIVGLELRAGRPRDQVLAGLAERTGVEDVSAFATVIQQSIAFGTSISDALQTYSKEMRHKRMMRAEEKANQLPVKMSVAMVLFLLPTLFLVALSPAIIRIVGLFSSGVFGMAIGGQ